MHTKLRTFMYASIGILALTLAFSVGFQMAAADTNPQGWGNVFAVEGDGTALQVLTIDGEYWRVNAAPHGWERPTDESYQLPIPVEQIAYYTPHAILATNGDAWIHNSAGDPWWINFGPPGDGPVPAERKSISNVRSMFGR